MCFLVGNLSPNSRYLPGLEMPPMCSSEKTSPRRRLKKKTWWRRRCVENQWSWVEDTQHYWQCVSLVLFVIICPFCHPERSWFLCWSWSFCWCCRQQAIPGARSEPNTKMPWNGEDVSRLQLWPGDGEWLITYWMTMEQRFCGAPRAMDIFLNDVLMYHVTENSAKIYRGGI